MATVTIDGGAAGRDGPAPVVVAYVATVVAAAGALAWLTLRPVPPATWPLWLALAALAVGARQLKIDLYARGSTSTHLIVLIAGAATLGPTGALALGAAVGLLCRWRYAAYRYLFDAAMFALVAGLLAALAARLPGLTSGAAPPLLVPTGLALGAAGYVLNHGLLVGAMALDEGLAPAAIWRERFAWLGPHYLVFGLLGAGLARVAADLGPTGALLFGAPLFALHLALQQYVARTTGDVAALRAAHDQLADEKAAVEGAHAALAAAHADLGRAQAATRAALLGMLRARDHETEGHSERVVGGTLALGRHLGLAGAALEALELGAILHDLGKVGVPDAILHKPGPLTDAEWAEMRRHPAIGHELTARDPALLPAAPIVRHHHERWDGTGYPDGLGGATIPLGARIFTLADTFDAMTSDRPYRAGLAPAAAVAEIAAQAGRQFDPAVVAAFLELAAAGGWPGLPASDDARLVVRRRASDWRRGAAAGAATADGPRGR